MSEEQVRQMIDAMKEVARVATVMLDGEEATQIPSARAREYVTNRAPQFRHMSGDYWDVDHETFLRTKKAMLRLQRLVDFDCSTALWIRTTGAGTSLTLICRNGTVHRYSGFGTSRIEIDDALAACLESGEVTVPGPDEEKHTVTVLAPVFDSLGDVAGVLELNALAPVPGATAPTWE